MTSCPHPLGVACGCNTPDPCLTAFTLETPDKEYIYKGDGRSLGIITLVDEFKDKKLQGIPIEFTLLGKCSVPTPGCPSGYIKVPNGDYIHTLADRQCETLTLHYRPPKTGGRTALLDAFDLILGLKGLTTLPHTDYVVNVTQCDHHDMVSCRLPDYPNTPLLLGRLSAGDVEIWVYQQYTWTAEVKLSCALKRNNIDDEKRLAERDARLANGTHRGLAIPDKEIARSFSIEGEIEVNAGGDVTQYSSQLSGGSSNLTSSKRTLKLDLSSSFSEVRDQLPLINAISGAIEMVKSSTYQSKGKESVKLVAFDFKPPVISLKGKGKTRHKTGTSFGVDQTLTAGFSPLFEFSITLDLVQAAAAYFGMQEMVKEVREQARILEEKVKSGQQGAYVGAEFNIKLATKLETEGRIKRTLDSDHPEYDFSAEGTITLTGDANVRGGAKVWIVQGAFELKGEVIAEGKCALQTAKKHEGGQNEKEFVELVFYHNGIKADVEITVAGSVGNRVDGYGNQSGPGNPSLTGYKFSAKSERKVGYKREWVWAEPMKKEDSYFRLNVLGG